MAGTAGPNNQLFILKESSHISFQCPVLGTTNYPIWSLKIKEIFKAHGLWETTEPAVLVDSKKDNFVIAYLYQALPADMILQVGNCETAKDIWDSIRIRSF